MTKFDKHQNNEKKDGYEIENRITFKIYDMPTVIADKLVKYAKNDAGNKVWVAIKQLMEYQELHSRISALEKKIEELEGREKDEGGFVSIGTESMKRKKENKGGD